MEQIEDTDKIIDEMEEEFKDNEEYLDFMEYTYKLNEAHKHNTRLELKSHRKTINSLNQTVDNFKEEINHLHSKVSNISDELRNTQQKLNNTEYNLNMEEKKSKQMKEFLSRVITFRQVLNSIFKQLWKTHEKEILKLNLDFEKLGNETKYLRYKKLYERGEIKYALAVVNDEITGEVSTDLCIEYLSINQKFHPYIIPFDKQEQFLLDLKKISIEYPENCKINDVKISTDLIAETISIGKKILP